MDYKPYYGRTYTGVPAEAWRRLVQHAAQDDTTFPQPTEWVAADALSSDREAKKARVDDQTILREMRAVLETNNQVQIAILEQL